MMYDVWVLPQHPPFDVADTVEDNRRELSRLESRRAELVFQRAALLFDPERMAESSKLIREFDSQIEGIDASIRFFLQNIERIELRRSASNAQRSERLSSIGRYALLTCGCVGLAFLAFLFRESWLAAIPLLGLVLVLVTWPAFEKFRTLSTFTAVFETGKLDIAVTAPQTDEYLRMQGNLAKKKVLLEQARIDQQIEQIEQIRKSSREARNELNETRFPPRRAGAESESSGLVATNFGVEEQVEEEHHGVPEKENSVPGPKRLHWAPEKTEAGGVEEERQDRALE